MNRIEVNDRVYLAPITGNDLHNLVKHANDEDVSRNLCAMPYPYQLSDAVDWVEHVKKNKQEFGYQTNWSIYKSNGELIGGIGRHVRYGTESHKDEIGYWLGRTYWGEGIMTDVVRVYSDHLMKHEGLIRLEAVVFERNMASAAVLEKCGYEFEGTLKKAYKIGGEYLNGRVYALVR